MESGVAARQWPARRDGVRQRREERIQLNENTLWMGGPRDRNNPAAFEHLAEVRRLLLAGMPVEAYAVAEKYSMGQPFRLDTGNKLGYLKAMVHFALSDPNWPSRSASISNRSI